MSGVTVGTIAGVVSAVAAVGGTISSVMNAQSAEAQQKKSQAQAKIAADAQARQAQIEFNKANQKQTDTNALLSAAQQSAKGGPSGTMLTGPGGINPGDMSLGKATLLGA